MPRLGRTLLLLNSPMAQTQPHIPKPPWLRRSLPTGPAYEKVRQMLREELLHTVCQEAKCPNIWECFSRKTATFLILGNQCTRNCRFCSITPGTPGPVDWEEPARVAEAARELGLTYVVVTSVTRDDLSDGGASLFAQTIREIRRQIPEAGVEVLIPDFKGNPAALRTVMNARPDVLNHNVETVPRLYKTARPGADYRRSLELLARVACDSSGIAVKSGIMLGLGETRDEIEQTMRDILSTGCRILTIGQYLQPSRRHLPVARYIPPEAFDRWREQGLAMGFVEVLSGPLVRSSYHAREMYHAVTCREGWRGPAKSLG